MPFVRYAFKKRLLLFPLLIAMAVVSIGSTVATVQATSPHRVAPRFHSSFYNTNTQGCAPVDLVIALDQSNSMMPTPTTNTPSDPDDFRTEAAQLLITELLVNQLFECPDVDHRWAVVDFGEGRQVRADIAPFDISAQDLELGDTEVVQAFTNQLDDIIPVITAEERPNQTFRSLRFTDFRKPLAEAINNQFSNPRILADSNQPVNRAVVIITDGAPCVDDSSYECPESLNYQMSLAQRTRYMDEVYSYWQQHYEDAIDIYLIPINTHTNYLNLNTSSSQFATLYAYWQAMTGGENGRIFPVDRTGRTVTKAVTDISRQLLGRNEAIDLICNNSEGKFFIPPFLEQTEVIVLKEDFEDTFSLSYTLPNGQEVTVQEGNIVEPEPGNDESITYVNLGRSELYRFSSPIPGEWTFNVTDCDRMFVRMTPIYIEPDGIIPRGAINTFPAPPYYDEQNPLLYRVDLGGREPDKILQSLINTNIMITLTVWHRESQTESDGQRIQLFRDGDSTEFVSRPGDYVRTPVSGTYEVRIEGEFSAPDIRNPSELTTYKLFTEANYSFVATELSAFAVQLIAPTNQHWQLNEITATDNIPQPLPIEVALVSPNGADFPYDAAGINVDFEATLKQGDNPPQPIFLQPVGQNGHFMAQIEPPDLNELEIGVSYPYEFTVKFTGTYDDKTYYLGASEQTAKFTASIASGIRPILSAIDSDSIHTNFLASCPIISDWSVVKAQINEPAAMDIAPSVYIEVRHGDEYERATVDELEQMIVDDSVDFINGRLLLVDGIIEQENLRFVRREDKFVLATPLPEVIAPAEYIFEVTLRPDGNLADNFSAVSTTDSVSFERQETGFTDSTRCQQTMSVTGALLVLFAILFVWLITGPFRGVLLLTLNTGHSKSLRLARLWFIRRGGSREFRRLRLGDNAPDIARVRVTTTEDDDDRPAFQVETYDSEDGLIDDVVVSKTDPGNRQSLFHGSIEYR